VKFHWQISAGEFFESLRPAAFALSAFLSTWVLTSARRWGYQLYSGLAWALATFFFPLVVLPIYLIVRYRAKRSIRLHDNECKAGTESPNVVQTVPAKTPGRKVEHRMLAPLVYGVLLLVVTSVYLYRDYNSVDGHLARATQAKLASQPAKTIREYRNALALENNPHTHKLLGIELAESGQWTEALKEFRLAEQGGEPDDSLPFRMAQTLEATDRRAEAVAEYKKFLSSDACKEAPLDDRCVVARERVGKAQDSPGG